MKYTLAITLECNLACRYCYIGKTGSVMSLETAARIVDFMFERTLPGENMDIGFFGGEPLLEFDLIKSIIGMIKAHERYESKRVLFSMVTNGTVFSDSIAEDLERHNIILGISCDGPSYLQDASRLFKDGEGSSALVEKNIRRALSFFPFMPVNAVYSPASLSCLPDVIDYFASLGVKNIYLNPDINARWSSEDAVKLPEIYNSIGRKYIEFYRRGEPRHISLVDGKIVVILRGGYQPMEKCRMGKGEFAFGPSGNIYPCERLIGSDEGGGHCLGNVADGVMTARNCSHNAEGTAAGVCRTCGLLDYCMNWCGCTNFFATGDYNTAGPFICASEKAAIQTAYGILEELGREGFTFADHLAGTPLQSILGETGVLGAG